MGNEKLRCCHLTAQAKIHSRHRTGSHLLHMQNSVAARKKKKKAGKGLVILSFIDLQSKKWSFYPFSGGPNDS